MNILTDDQKTEIARIVADSLLSRKVTNPTGITLFAELRKASKTILGKPFASMKEVQGWFPEKLSALMDEVKTDATLEFLAEIENRISNIEVVQQAILEQNTRILKLLRRAKRHRHTDVFSPPSLSKAQHTLRVVVVGVEGAYRRHLTDKLKGFPVEIIFKHFRDLPETYGNFDRVVFFAKHGDYYAETKKLWPAKVFAGTGGLKTVQNIIQEFLKENENHFRAD